MLATAGLAAWLDTQRTPATTSESVPSPLQSSTRTATRRTFLATPYRAPPIVPATCVPCPLQSAAVASSPTKSQPYVARPANWVWVIRMPVSITYAVTAPASSVGVYDFEPRAARWSIRSRPHVGFVWVPSMCRTRSCSTSATSERAASRRACLALIEAVYESPPTACADIRAEVFVRVTMYRPLITPGASEPTMRPSAARAGRAVPATATAAAVSRVPMTRIRMPGRSVGPRADMRKNTGTHPFRPDTRQVIGSKQCEPSVAPDWPGPSVSGPFAHPGNGSSAPASAGGPANADRESRRSGSGRGRKYPGAGRRFENRAGKPVGGK